MFEENSKLLEKSDQISKLRELDSSLVLQLFGTVGETLNPTYTEEAIIEIIIDLIKNISGKTEDIVFKYMQGKSFLFIGCNYEDWLFRFFIRALFNRKYDDKYEEDQRKFISDDFDNLKNHSLVIFLENNETQVFYPGNSVQFVDELFNRLLRINGEIVPENNFSKTAFISFIGADRYPAKLLAERLRADGISVWYDEWKIGVGSSVMNAIKKGIDSCRAFIPIYSENASALFVDENKSLKYHIHEWEWAFSNHLSGQNPKYILPVSVDDGDFRYELFKDLAYLRIPKGKGVQYEELRGKLLDIQGTS